MVAAEEAKLARFDDPETMQPRIITEAQVVPIPSPPARPVKRNPRKPRR